MAGEEITAESPSPGEMQAALLRSGYLLESRAATVLRKMGFQVTHSPSYTDPVTGRSRELDIEASGLHQDIHPLGSEDCIWAELLVECVNPPRPLVFFEVEAPSEWDGGHGRIKMAGPPTQQPPELLDFNWHWLLREVAASQCHHYFIPGSVATQYCSFDKKKSGPGRGEWFAQHREQDYEALRSLVAATDLMLQRQHEAMSEEFPWLQLVLFFPVLLVQGEIFAASPTKRSVRLKRTEHVRLHWSRSEGRHEHRYVIDVVSERHLAEYVRRVESSVQGLSARVRHRMPAVFNDAIKRAKEFRAGSPRDWSSPVPESVYELGRQELADEARSLGTSVPPGAPG